MPICPTVRGHPPEGGILLGGPAPAAHPVAFEDP